MKKLNTNASQASDFDKSPLTSNHCEHEDNFLSIFIKENAFNEIQSAMLK